MSNVITVHDDSCIRIVRRAAADSCPVYGRIYEYAIISKDGMFCIACTREDVARFIRSGGR